VYDAIAANETVFLNTSALANRQGEVKLNADDAKLSAGEQKQPLQAQAAGKKCKQAESKCDEERAMKEKPVSTPPPKTYKQAMKSPWRVDYMAAAKKEYDGHIKNATWERASDLCAARKEHTPGQMGI